jgi:hypothetical protein
MNPSPAPMTLGSAAAAHLRLIVWCQEYCHRVEPDPAEMAERLRRRDYRAGLGGEACAWPVGAAAAESINGGFPRCTRHASPGDAHRDHRRGQCRGSCC